MTHQPKRGDPRATGSADPIVRAQSPLPPAHSSARSAKRAVSTVAGVPIPVIVAAVCVGALAVMLTAVAMRPRKPTPAQPLAATSGDSTPRADSALDIRWRSGRMDGDDCLGTFEVTRGTGTGAQFVAFVMDKTGAVMGRDSARVSSAVRGLLVDFRFRHVDCKKIDDWQLQATTPKRRSP